MLTIYRADAAAAGQHMKFHKKNMLNIKYCLIRVSSSVLQAQQPTWPKVTPHEAPELS